MGSATAAMKVAAVSLVLVLLTLGRGDSARMQTQFEAATTRNPIFPVAGGQNVTSASGLVGSGTLPGGGVSCPEDYSPLCVKEGRCCQLVRRFRRWKCDYTTCADALDEWHFPI